MSDFATTSERVKVPHDPLYVEYIDRERYIEELEYQFYTLIDTHRAWLVMLVDKGIVPTKDAAAVLRGLKELKSKGPEAIEYKPGYNDVYTHIEQWLIDKVGREPVAHLSLARTRPEPLMRMYFRERILDCLEEMYNFRTAVLDSAEKNKDTVMPGYTHQQHGQPTTFGAYLLAIHDPLARASAWLEMAYATTNESTMGCGALAGTAFPIDRYQVAELLGFDSIMESTIASVSTGDHLVQSTSAANDAMITLSRMCLDMEQWSNTEAKFMEPAPEFSDVSSMMPQKKNPCVFEFARGKISRVLGDTVGIYAGLLKSFYADVIDLEMTYGPSLRVLDQTRATMKFMTGVINTMIIHSKRMLETTAEGFSTVSELADEIFRSTGLPHRLAHSIVANTVTRALHDGMVATDITAEYVEKIAGEVIGRKLGLSDAQVKKALDPVEFVKSHDVPGGPAPAETLRIVKERRKKLAEERSRLAGRRKKVTEAEKALDQAAENLISGK
ncbi:MAG: argininosuccinate lyase [Spirochaetaceae bacterium]|nr:MAG: argininosuccinate lyase [Spirochaetaceae bacterium]